MIASIEEPRGTTSLVTVARRHAAPVLASTRARRYGIRSVPGVFHTGPSPREVTSPLLVTRTLGATGIVLRSLRQIASV